MQDSGLKELFVFMPIKNIDFGLANVIVYSAYTVTLARSDEPFMLACMFSIITLLWIVLTVVGLQARIEELKKEKNEKPKTDTIT